jgi:hypothetical protein
VIGLGPDEDGDLHLWLRENGEETAGCFGSPTEVTVYPVFLSIEEQQSTRSWVYSKQLPTTDLVCTASYMKKSEEVSLFDVDPQRCLKYFGVVPGQWIDCKAIAVGMTIERGYVQMWFHVVGSWGVGLFSDGTVLYICDRALSRLPPLSTEPSSDNCTPLKGPTAAEEVFWKSP